MRGRRRAVLGCAAGAGVVLAMASMAWACTNFIRIDRVSPVAEQSASSVVVRGVQAVSNSTVDLRWNRTDGPVLAQAQADAAGSFTARVDVPKVSPGIYVITATSEGNVARSAVEVGAGGALAPSDASLDLARPADEPGNGNGMTLLAAGLLLLAAGAVVASGARRSRVRARAVPAPSAPASADRFDDLVEVGR